MPRTSEPPLPPDEYVGQGAAGATGAVGLGSGPGRLSAGAAFSTVEPTRTG
jgi:hypothetical protein